MTSELKCAPKRVPTSWTIAHDAALREVREKGHENWWELAQKPELLSHFTHHRLQTRWETELDVLLNVGPWTPEEDAKLSSPVERAVKYQRVDYMSRQLKRPKSLIRKRMALLERRRQMREPAAVPAAPAAPVAAPAVAETRTPPPPAPAQQELVHTSESLNSETETETDPLPTEPLWSELPAAPMEAVVAPAPQAEPRSKRVRKTPTRYEP